GPAPACRCPSSAGSSVARCAATSIETRRSPRRCSMDSDRPRTIGVVTTSRADYSYYRPILRRIVGTPGLRLRLFVTGMHVSETFGLTAAVIEQDGFEIAERVDMLVDGDSPEAVGVSIGTGV